MKTQCLGFFLLLDAELRAPDGVTSKANTALLLSLSLSSVSSLLGGADPATQKHVVIDYRVLSRCKDMFLMLLCCSVWSAVFASGLLLCLPL